MSKCKTCKGSGKVPQMDLYGNPIIPQVLENCIFCNGTGKEVVQKEQTKDQEYGNSLLDWTFDLLKNQDPFQV